MTEAEWLACDDAAAMLDCLRSTASERSMRLYGVACYRLLWWDSDDGRGHAAVEIAERFAEGQAVRAELEAARETFRAWGTATTFLCCAAWETTDRDAWRAATGVAGRPDYLKRHPIGFARATQAALVRDIFGNPFRPHGIDATRRTATALSLAQSAYGERELPGGLLDTAGLAVLSDALEEVGGTDADTLSHLRSPGPHVRGCWALDLVLGRE